MWNVTSQKLTAARNIVTISHWTNLDVIYELLISLKCYARSDKNIIMCHFKTDLDNHVWYDVVWISLIHLKWGHKFSFNLIAVVCWSIVKNKLCDIRTRSYCQLYFWNCPAIQCMIFFVYGNALVDECKKRVEEKTTCSQ